MEINKMAGWCLIIFGVVNVLHEIHLRNVGRGQPGIAYTLVTSILFTAGAALLWGRKIRENRSRVKSNSFRE